MSTPSLKVVVAITSPIAFELLEKTSILHATFGVARAFTIETSINTEAEVRVSADQYDEGVWLCLQGRRSMMSVPLTRVEAEQLMVNLKKILTNNPV